MSVREMSGTPTPLEEMSSKSIFVNMLLGTEDLNSEVHRIQSMETDERNAIGPRWDIWHRCTDHIHDIC